MSARTTVPSVRGRKVRRGDVPLVMVTAYDAPGARMADAAGVDMILVGDSSPWSCSATTTPCRSPSTTWPTTPPRSPGPSPRPLDRRRPAVDELPRVGRGHRPQRRPADPGRRPGREARGRPQAPPDDRGHRRRRDPGDGPHRPHPAVGPRHGRVQGAGPQARRRARRWSRTPRRSQHAGCFAIVLEGVPDEVGRMLTEAIDVPTIGIGAGPGTRRPGARVPRRARHRGPHHPEVRAPLRRPRRRGRPCPERLRRRRAHRGLPRADESYHLTAGEAEALGLYGAHLA